ncbi:class I SAM-dependent methyltransferase [Actinocorallia libanotica]|uniref:Class I SAM-dependent methyltransferase n=1 Tax=Actinocorallia libanotica TaxID=46162 RepID=A0ABN1R1G3_9ACTN
MEAEDWDRKYAAKELLWSVEPNRFAAEGLAGLPPGRALDLACGEGRNALWLASRGWKVRAVDFSPVAVARARELDREGAVEWEVADLTAYPFPVAAEDLVLVSYLHLPPAQMRPVLANAARALAPGGTFFFVGHDLENLEHGTGGPQDPDVLHTPEAVAGALDGLEVVRAERLTRPVGERTAVDTLVVARAPAA